MGGTPLARFSKYGQNGRPANKEDTMLHPDFSRAIINDRVSRYRAEAKASKRAAKAKGKGR